MRRTAALLLALAAIIPLRAEEKKSDASEFISWLLQEDRDLKGIPFSEVLAATTGKKILPIDPSKDQAWLKKLGAILDRTLAKLNDPAHPMHAAGRINEASRFIEDELLAECAKEKGWSCGIPKTSAGEEQRSGYPDLRLVLEDGSVVYLDPKLFATDSRASSFRTFYYEPKTTTSKVQDDARHLLVGVHHNEAQGGQLRLEGWDLVDVSRIQVQLKAEFQASNNEMYRDETIVLQSPQPTP
jgi:hypothetical protein